MSPSAWPPVLKYSLGAIRVVKMRNQHIRGTDQVEQFAYKLKEKREMVWTCAGLDRCEDE